MRSMICVLLCFTLVSCAATTAPQNTVSVMSWPDTQVDIASHVTNDNNFFRSITLFRGLGQFYIEENRYKKVEGDSTEDINGYEVVHILGDLNHSVTINDQAEVVVRKNLTKDAIIYASGIQKVYVGGDFLGRIESTGSLELIVKGDFKGTLTSGHPSTEIIVEHDFDGIIKPTNPDDGGLLSVHIKGETLLTHMETICAQKYTVVKITVANIDADKGIYTCGTRHRLVVEK